MSDSSPAQSTLKRLIEAEAKARTVIQSAEQSAEGAIGHARAEAAQSLDKVRQESAWRLQSRLTDVATQAAAETKRRLQSAEDQARDIERRAAANLAAAADLVAAWIMRPDD